MQDSIRILQIVPNMQQGGLENFIMNIYRNIDKQKVQFDFLVHYQKRQFFDDEIVSMGGRIYRFSLRDNNNILKYIKELNKFYKIHKEYKVIHCHMSSIGFINFLVAKKNGIKVRIAHSHNNATDKTLKGIIKRVLIKPYKYISTVNFACSNSAGKFLFGRKKFEVIPNAIDVKKFEFNLITRENVRKNLNISEDDFVIGHVGRFNIQKNHEFIVEIFNKIQSEKEKSKLIFVGTGELENVIKGKIKSLNLEDKVYFLTNRNDVNELYQAFDCFLFPSLFEGLGIALIEAQISGLKCYTSKYVVAKETHITENITYLSLNDNEEVWAKEILENSDYKRMSHGEEAKKYGFEISILAKKMEEKYIILYGVE